MSANFVNVIAIWNLRDWTGQKSDKSRKWYECLARDPLMDGGKIKYRNLGVFTVPKTANAWLCDLAASLHYLAILALGLQTQNIIHYIDNTAANEIQMALVAIYNTTCQGQFISNEYNARTLQYLIGRIARKKTICCDKNSNISITARYGTILYLDSTIHFVSPDFPAVFSNSGLYLVSWARIF